MKSVDDSKAGGQKEDDLRIASSSLSHGSPRARLGSDIIATNALNTKVQKKMVPSLVPGSQESIMTEGLVVTPNPTSKAEATENKNPARNKVLQEILHKQVSPRTEQFEELKLEQETCHHRRTQHKPEGAAGVEAMRPRRLASYGPKSKTVEVPDFEVVESIEVGQSAAGGGSPMTELPPQTAETTPLVRAVHNKKKRRAWRKKRLEGIRQAWAKHGIHINKFRFHQAWRRFSLDQVFSANALNLIPTEKESAYRPK